MLRHVVAIVTTVGAGFVAAGVGWRCRYQWVADLSERDALTLLAVRDGVTAALVAVGFGLGLVALGTLELLGGVGDAGPLVKLASVLPIREAGEFLVTVGFGLLACSLLVPVAIEVRRRARR